MKLYESRTNNLKIHIFLFLDELSNETKYVRTIEKETTLKQAGEVLEELKEDFPNILIHVNTKRTQAAAFQVDKAKCGTLEVQVDYAMSFQCEYQDEVGFS